MAQVRLGLQIWSIFDVCVEKGMGYAIERAREMGYEGIEFAMGHYPTIEAMTGVKPDELGRILKANGMTPIGHHIKSEHLLTCPELPLAEAVALGEEYSAAFPLFYGDREVSKGQIAKYVRFREVVRMFRDSGVKLVVHGSGYGYLNDYKGRLVIEGMLEEANADPELDTCWMILGGVDVEKYIRKYRGRVDLLHLKDFKPPYEESEYVIVRQNSIENRWRECYTAVGQDGVLDLPRVVKTAVECGTKWLIVELWNERESLENACVSAENIRRYL